MDALLPATIDIPHIDQYLGLWAIKEDVFLQAVQRAELLNLSLHLKNVKAEDIEARSDVKPPVIRGDIAVVNLEGTLMKHVSSFAGGTSTIMARRQIRAAVADDDVASILLKIDSPGGTVSGTDDLAKDIAAASEKKPVFAFVEDLGASAAFWLASQADKVFANETGMVGSIGTFAVIHDLSGLAAREGIKVHVFRAGQFKGAGIPGTEITTEQQAEFQRRVDELNDFFVRAVARGRGMTLAAVRDLADGRVHIGAKAAALGLIDGVQTFEETLNALQARNGTPRRSRNASTHYVTLNPALEQKLTLTLFAGNPPNIATDGEPGAKDGPAHTTDERTEPMADAKATEIQYEALEPTSWVETELKSSDDHEADYAAITRVCKGLDPSKAEDTQFICDQLARNATIAQARDAWAETLQARIEIREQELSEARQRQATQKPAGVKPLEDATAKNETSADGDPVSEFEQQIQDKVKAGMSRSRAVASVVRQNPDLHRAYVQAVNEEAGRPNVLPAAYAV